MEIEWKVPALWVLLVLRFSIGSRGTPLAPSHTPFVLSCIPSP